MAGEEKLINGLEKYAGYNKLYSIMEMMMNLFEKIFGPSVPVLSAVELQDKLKGAQKPMVLDVRQPEEYSQGHISGAKLIPLGDLSNKLSGLSKQKEIVCVCASGSRSSSASKLLMGAGFNVFNMRGGMAAWKSEKLPIKKGTAA